MKNYKTYEFIRKDDITFFDGLNRDVLTSFIPSAGPVPLTVECFGITFPEKRYHIKRTKSVYFTLEYVVSGKGTVINNGETFTVGANDVYLLEPGKSHEYFADPDEPYKKYWINFVSDIFYDIFNAYGLEGVTVFRNVDLSKEFEQIFEIEKLSLDNDEIYEPVSQILFGMFMKLSKSNHRTHSAPNLARRIKYLLDLSASDNTSSIEEIAAKLFISRSKLFREFKKAYGITPHAYLIDQKILLAKRLLKNTRQSVHEISEALNFSSDIHFCSCFKSKTGQTPKEYRKST